MPRPLHAVPVQRVIQTLCCPPIPTFRQPEHGVLVAPALHKGRKFSLGNKARGQCVRVQVRAMAWAFVVKRKAFAFMADFDEPSVERMPRQSCSHGRWHHIASRRIDREQRVARQQVLYVGEHQLLVLLLVLQAQLDQGTQRGIVRHVRQQARHAGIHIGPVGQHFMERGARKQPPLRARVLGPHTVVVRVEKHPERGRKRRKPGLVRFEHEGFKKPGGVGQVPFGGAGVRHGLRAAVLGRQGRRQCHRATAHGGVAGLQCVGCHGHCSH